MVIHIGKLFGCEKRKLIKRSPFSNEYDPPMEEGVLPSEKLREMEIQFNNVFKAYTQA